MKKLTFFTAMFIACTSFAQVPNYVSTNGLVGWWPFNGNANDESGNGKNGTVNGATLTTDRFGVANKAYTFNGTTNNIYIANSILSFSPSSCSFSFWFNTSDNDACFMSDRSPGINYAKYQIMISNNLVSSNSYSSQCNTTPANSIYTANTWSHATIVKDQNSLTERLYINGVLVSSTNGLCYWETNNGTYFGVRGGSSIDAYYSGILDDIGIWNRALTQQEITNLYNGVYNLPVELAQFSATCSGNTTNINWQTATEHNSAYFEVLNSRDGESWNSLTTVDAAGNSSEAINYSISDNTDASTVYYKLNQVDKDGKSQEYGPISANCNENTSLFITPNPTNGEFNLIGMEHFGTITSLEVKDATGKVVKAMQPTTTQFTCNELKAGVYFLTVSAGKTMKVIKIIKE
jgi:hypothetical protein